MNAQAGFLVLLSVPLLAGCGALQRPPKASMVDLRPQSRLHARTRSPNRTPKAAEVTTNTVSRDKETSVAEVVRPHSDDNDWLSRTRRQLVQVTKDIKADLEFHEAEGLEAFSPDALEQVNALRGEMNGPSDITH